MIRSISSTAVNSLSSMLNTLQKEPEISTEKAFLNALPIQPSEAIVSQNHSNLPSTMSRNFVGATKQSQYIEATEASLQAKKQVVLQSHMILVAAAAEMLAANGIDATNCGSAASAEMEMRRVSNTKVLKESERNLDEIQESIEENAQQAIAPKDENGNPVDKQEHTDSIAPEFEAVVTETITAPQTMQPVEQVEPSASEEMVTLAVPLTMTDKPVLKISINITV